MKLNPGLLWRSQDVRDARVVEYLQIRTANREWKHSKRRKCVVLNKAEWNWKSEEHFDIRHGDAEFRVCPAGFQSCFGPVFPHYASFPIFWNSHIYTVHYVLEV